MGDKETRNQLCRDSTEVRALRGEEELDSWLDFVVACFAFKGTPREHFSNHFHLDPWREAKAIFIAEEKEEIYYEPSDPAAPRADTIRTRCTSTLRCFCRKIYIHGAATKCAGIGEVCTREDRRRRGLSNLVLTHAENVMRVDGFTLASLHSSQMAAVYKKAGFEAIPLSYTMLGCGCDSKPTEDTVVEPANLKDGNLISQLMLLHDSFNTLFDGPIVRDHAEYWSGYMHGNMQDSGFILRRSAPNAHVSHIVAFATLKTNKTKAGAFFLADFFAAEAEVARDGGLSALQVLVGAALTQRGVDRADVMLPTAVAARMQLAKGHSSRGERADGERDHAGTAAGHEGTEADHAGTAADHEGTEADHAGSEPQQEVDLGFMYKRLEGEGRGYLPDSRRHVFWPVDGF